MKFLIFPIVLVLMVLVLQLVVSFYDYISKNHDWSYRNPYSRRCLKCGHCEDLYGDALGPDVWEAIYPLAHSPENCRVEKDDAD